MLLSSFLYHLHPYLPTASLLDPAYGEIGPNTCVGLTGGWAVYSWPPAIILVSVMMVFLLDFLAEQYVARKYGFFKQVDVETLVTNRQVDSDRANGAAPQQPHPPSTQRKSWPLNYTTQDGNTG